MTLYPGRHEPTVTCAHCGSRYRERRATCPRCGVDRGTQVDRAEAPSTERRSARNGLTIGGLALATVVVGLLAWPSSRHQATRAEGSLLGTVAPTGAPARPAQPASPKEGAGAGGDSTAGTRAFLDDRGAAAVAYSEGRVEEAFAHFQKVLEEQPGDPEALNNVGQLLVRLGRPAEALPYLENVAGRFPERWDFQFNLARALGEAGRWSEAVERYQDVATRRPDDDVTAFNLARSLERAGRVPEAVGAYQKALGLAPWDPSFHLALAQAHERAGDLAGARRAYEGYLALWPEGEHSGPVRERVATLPEPAAEGTSGDPPV